MKIHVDMNNSEEGVLEIDFFRGKTLLHNVFYDIEGLSDEDIYNLKREAVAKFCAVFPGIPLKDVMRGFSAVDNQMEKLYKQTFPCGGVRAGAGRKKLPEEIKRNKHNIYCTDDELIKVRDFLRSIRKKNSPH